MRRNNYHEKSTIPCRLEKNTPTSQLAVMPDKFGSWTIHMTMFQGKKGLNCKLMVTDVGLVEIKELLHTKVDYLIL